MLKKVTAILMAGAMAVTALTGCGINGGDGQNSDKVKISFSFWEPSTGTEMEDAIAKIVENYKSVRPDVEVELISQPVSGYQEWIKTRFASNQAPTIESNHATIIGEQYEQGLTVDLKEALESESPYDKKTWKDCFVDGKLEQATDYTQPWHVALPLFDLGVAYYYNMDLYEKLNLKVPETWNEFIQNCEAIEKDGTNPIAFMAQKKDAVLWFMWYLNTGLLGDAFLSDSNINVNGDCAISNNEIAAAISNGKIDLTSGKYKELQERFWDEVKNYAKYSKNATGFDEAAAKSQLLTGKAAHLMSGSWDLQTFMENEENVRIGAFKLPAFTTDNSEYVCGNPVIGGVQSLAITKSAEKDTAVKEAAIDFLQFMFSKEQYKIFVDSTKQIPTVKDLDIDPIFEAFQGGSVPVNNILCLDSDKMAQTPTDAVMQLLSGDDFDYADMEKKLNENYKMWLEEYESDGKFTKENNYGLDELDMRGGKYEKTR